MGFKYSLETVLDVRRREEEAHQRRVAEAVSILGAHERRQQELEGRKAQAAGRRAERIGQRCSPAELLQFDAYDLDLRSQIEQARQDIEAAQAELDSRRVALLAAARRREALEALKREERAQYERGEMLDERKRNDEIAIFSVGREGTAKLSVSRPRGGK